jgi:hypothetical protein
MGNELRDPVEMQHDRDAAELDIISPATMAPSVVDPETPGIVATRGVPNRNATSASLMQAEQMANSPDDRPFPASVELP